jgi:hypothetical protein
LQIGDGTNLVVTFGGEALHKAEVSFYLFPPLWLYGALLFIVVDRLVFRSENIVDGSICYGKVSSLLRLLAVMEWRKRR